MNRAAGFTIFELVMVILLLGVVTTFVAGRAGSDFRAVRDAEELIQAIRYTQERAMHHTGDGQNYRITLSVGGYSLSPAPAPLYADGLDGVLEGSALSPAGVIAFDGRGSPSCSGGLVCANSVAQILVSASGDSSILTLQPYTGLVNR